MHSHLYRQRFVVLLIVLLGAFPAHASVNNPFLRQALSEAVQMSLVPIFHHRAQGFQSAVFAMQEDNVLRMELVNNLQVMHATRQSMIAAITKGDIDEQQRWKSVWLEQWGLLIAFFRRVPFYENAWLPELAELVATSIRDDTSLNWKKIQSDRPQGLEYLVDRIRTRLAKPLDIYRRKLRHPTMLDSQKLWNFLNGFAAAPPNPLFIEETAEAQDFYEKDFLKILLLGMLKVICALPNTAVLNDPEGLHETIQAMTIAARRAHASYDIDALRKGDYMAMQELPVHEFSSPRSEAWLGTGA